MRHDTRFSEVASSVGLFLAASPIRPLFFYGREAVRNRLSVGDSDDGYLLTRRDAFLRHGPDPTKVGTCARVARATFTPTEGVILAAGLYLTGWTVASFQTEISQTWEKIQTALESYAK